MTKVLKNLFASFITSNCSNGLKTSHFLDKLKIAEVTPGHKKDRKGLLLILKYFKQNFKNLCNVFLKSN